MTVNDAGCSVVFIDIFECVCVYVFNTALGDCKEMGALSLKVRKSRLSTSDYYQVTIT